jgi:hypothetical protein
MKNKLTTSKKFYFDYKTILWNSNKAIRIFKTKLWIYQVEYNSNYTKNKN